jgi:hypothetical protein
MTKEYAQAVCGDCLEPTIFIPIKQWLQTHDNKSGTTEWIPEFDLDAVEYDCDCDGDELDIQEPDVVNWVTR